MSEGDGQRAFALVPADSPLKKTGPEAEPEPRSVHNCSSSDSIQKTEKDYGKSYEADDTVAPEEHGADLERHVTRESKRSGKNGPSVTDLKSVPDGGTQAWMQVLGSFFLFFNSWGIVNTFGVYQTFYVTEYLRSSSPSNTAWIGSVQAFLLTSVGAVCGPIYDAGYFRHLVVVGSFLVVFGHMMLSLCQEYWQIFLAQGVAVGVGAGMLFVPSVAILSTYFNKRLATATGIAAAGSSIGGVLYPIVVYRLLPVIGFAWTTRVVGFFALATLIIPNLVMKVRTLPAAKRKIVDWAAFKEPSYALFVLGGFFGFAGIYAPFFYVEDFSLTYHLADENLSFYTLSAINAGSLFGRVLPNLIADRTGPLNIITPSCFFSGILCLCLIAVRNVGPLFVICVLYGFTTGTLVSLPATVYVSISQHRRHLIGTRMGMGLFVNSIGLLIGAPACGWILGASSFTFVWVFGGLLLLMGSVAMAAARVAKTRTLSPFVKA